MTVVKTISNEVAFTGTTLMSGLNVHVRFYPSQETGIRFYSPNSSFKIEKSVDNVISTQYCTVLGNAHQETVMLVEHLLAALSFLNINTLDIYLNGGNELPIADGSSLEWYTLLKEYTVNDHNPSFQEEIELLSSVHVSQDDSFICTLPSDKFKITYLADFNHNDLSQKWITWEKGVHDSDIIDARTFGYLKDLPKMQALGLSKGVSLENCVGLTEEGYTSPLRNHNEPIKHKILDLIGDLSLLDVNPFKIKAHIICCKGGHTLHLKFAQLLQKSINEIRWST